jgi:hypothetical protein
VPRTATGNCAPLIELAEAHVYRLCGFAIEEQFYARGGAELVVIGLAAGQKVHGIVIQPRIAQEARRVVGSAMADHLPANWSSTRTSQMAVWNGRRGTGRPTRSGPSARVGFRPPPAHL